MKTYRVSIEIDISEDYDVEAESKEEAIEMAIEEAEVQYGWEHEVKIFNSTELKEEE